MDLMAMPLASTFIQGRAEFATFITYSWSKGVEKAVLLSFLVEDKEMPMGLIAKQYHESVLPLLISDADLFVCLASMALVGGMESLHFHQYLLFQPFNIGAT